MQYGKGLILAAVVACLSLTAYADSNATFTNAGGNWQSTGSGINSTVLHLTNSQLTGVSNLTAPYNCPAGSVLCSGSVSLDTGTLQSGVLNPAGPCGIGGCTAATFNPGGQFNITSTGAGGGFTFTGTFSGASWQKFGSGSSVFWTFIGQVANGTLTLGNGMVFSNIDAGTIHFTTVGGAAVFGGGGLQWTNNTGSTNFPSPVPEPGTLGLFGSGLIALGLLRRRKLSGKVRL